MEFFTYSNQPRPVRLCEGTRLFAFESLNRKYGRDTKAVYAVSLDLVPGFAEKSDFEKYGIAIAEIAAKSRIRICPGELLSGSATLGAAIDHLVPATYCGSTVFQSVSHLTVNFPDVLKFGIKGIEARVQAKLAEADLTDSQTEFLNTAQVCISAFRTWHGRYLEALKDRPEYAENYANLTRVPFDPPQSFYEAVQSIWFTFAFLRLCGNWPGIGRIDCMLGDYLEKDLAGEKITLDRAREILAHFFIKGCEWVAGDTIGSGDAQHYQNLVLSGVDENGQDTTNLVTYLVLDILEEFNIGDFPTTVRLNSASPEKLLRRLAEIMKHGGGVLAVYNEETVIKSMTSAGYTLAEARGFANDGCWEMQVPGKTNFGYIPFDGLALLLNDTLGLNTDAPAHFDSFEELKKAYYTRLDRQIGDIYSRFFTPEGDRRICGQPAVAVSIFEEGCIETATDYLSGGAKYFVRSPHLGGAADAGNSLQAIDRLCFIEKKIDFDGFMQILKANWEGHEELRQYALKGITGYGNDSDGADSYTVDLVNTFARLVHSRATSKNNFFVPGISTFGRQIEWRAHRTATPHGHRAGDILAPNMSATPGSDIQGATALIKSYCKLDLTLHTTGAALDLKLTPSVVKGEKGTMALVGLMRGFVLLGGCFMQPDIVDNSVLKDAQEHPENYGSLCIRISGWNARFVTLSREWQDMCIEKSTHGEI